MSPLFSRPASSLAFVLLAVAATAGTAEATPSVAPTVAVSASDDVAALPAARDRTARADAAVDALKRALGPGHLTDPTPEVDGAYGLETLRGEVADLQRKAAGYRAILGDRHPTLLGTEQVMAEFKSRLQTETRAALAAAQREAAEARTAVDGLDRRLAARTQAPPLSAAEATGSIMASPSVPATAPRPRAAARPAAARHEEAATAVDGSGATGLDRLSGRWSDPLLALAAGALGLLLSVVAARRLGRARRATAHRRVPRVEPAMAATATTAEPPRPAAAAPPALELPAAAARDAVPVLATLPLPRSAAPIDVAALFSREPDGALAQAAAALHATLRHAVAGAPETRLTVLMTDADGLDQGDGDAAALALALAAAAAGRRAVILETRAAGRLRGSLVAPGTAPMLVAAGGTERTLYRVDAGDLTIAVLPTDAGEAEAAAAAGAHPGTGRILGLDLFDTVVLVGENAAALARAADVVIVAASASGLPAAIAEAARPCREAGRVCGALIVARPSAASASVTRLSTRRRSVPDTAHAAPARLGLRGSIEPSRRRA